MNPADYPSRGISFKRYTEISWWKGPAWLYEDENLFPCSSPTVNLNEVNKEKKKTVVSFATTRKQLDKLQPLRLGDWDKVLRVVAYCLRLGKKRRSAAGITVSKSELEEAEKAMLFHIQTNEKEFMIKHQTEFQSFVDKDGITRIITKLVHGEEFSTEFQYPALLPGNNGFVKLLIIKEHSLRSHCGVQYLVAQLRQKFWITCCRRSVRSILHRCPICRVHYAKACKVIQAPLPALRINTTHCFDTIGVDLAGPLTVKCGRKVWIVLFTCAVYRAVHMEIVTTVSTEDFLFALRKFIARRGRPSVIYSDNGTNFKGTANLLEINWPKIQEFAAVRKIAWIFNAPTGAWWGGFWERLIGMMKEILRRNLGARVVTMEELDVLVVEAEGVLKDRPLTYLSEDPSDLQPLTPAHFMRDLQIAVLPEGDVNGDLLRKNVKHIARLREELKSRFQTEYLAMLVCDGKVKRTTMLQPGSVVLIENENKKRITWPMGIILEIFQGRDGVFRTAKVRTKDGEYIRPLQRLFPLEMSCTEELAPEEVIKKAIKQREKEPTQVELDTDEDDVCEPEALLSSEEVEPLVTTKSGRKILKPIRLVENLTKR